MVTQYEGLFCEQNGQIVTLQPKHHSDLHAVQYTYAFSLRLVRQQCGLGLAECRVGTLFIWYLVLYYTKPNESHPILKRPQPRDENHVCST